MRNTAPPGRISFFTVGEENFVDDVEAYAADFDQEEHVETWAAAKLNGTVGIPSIEELLEDAKAIDEMIRELAGALFASEREGAGA